MNPQGSALINVEHFKNMAASLKGAESCEELQKLVNEAMASIQAIEAATAAELAKVNAILALLVPPGANLGQIVTWITSLINDFIEPMTRPNVTLPLQIAEILEAVNELKQAIEDIQVNFPNCSISFS